jgi:hypothetical protein
MQTKTSQTKAQKAVNQPTMASPSVALYRGFVINGENQIIQAIAVDIACAGD